MLIKKVLPFFLCLIIFICGMVINVQAEEVSNEKVYNPLDLVVVVDNSGSMASSDKSRTAPAAVRMLVNMMPAADSRVAVIGFNTKANVLTKNSDGKNALISLTDFVGVETIRDDVSNMKYNGGTGIGNAIYAATELLREQSTADHTKAIILFTDGINDFGYNKLALSECDSNEASAIQWAQKNDCFIYCVGYDYITASGKSSMGANGEGITKLKNIAGNTKGKFKAIHNISEIEQLLIEFLADVCDLNYKTVATIPGDGAKHECKIPVSPSVVEANIRIAGGGKNAIKNGKIKLYDPDGDEVKLSNSGNIRFDTDATAASIKVIMPKQGEWLLVVEGINGDDIHVGLLEHFKMNLTSTLTFPKGNPKGVAYTNDTIGIKTWLTYDGADITDKALYDAVTSATAVCVSRANPDDKKTVTLKRDGLSFTGSFVIPEDSFYDINVRLDWDTVYREDVLTVKSSNKPPQLVKDIETVRVNKNKTVTVKDIYSYVSDDENDLITASISNISSPDVVDAKLNSDNSTLEITGKKWSSTLITVVYKDAQGNVVQTTFKVIVNDPVAVAIIIGILLLLAGLIILALALLKKASNRVKGKIRVIYISDGIIDNANSYKSTKLIYQNPNVDHDIQMAQNFSEQPKAFDSPFGSGGFGSTDGGFGSSNNGFAKTEDGFGATENGFGSGGNGFGSTDNGFGSGTNGFGNTDNGFGNSNSGFGGADSGFGSTDSGFGSSDSSFGSTDNSFGSTGGFGADMGAFGAAPEQKVSAEEEDRSRAFNEKFSIASSRQRKTTLKNILELFVKYYGDFMLMQKQESLKFNDVKEYVEQKLYTVFSRVHVLGTLYGKSGVVLKTEKQLTSDTVIFHSPRLEKNKAAINPKNRTVVISVSVINGEKDKNGNIPCSHIEMEYSK